MVLNVDPSFDLDSDVSQDATLVSPRYSDAQPHSCESELKGGPFLSTLVKNMNRCFNSNIEDDVQNLSGFDASFTELYKEITNSNNGTVDYNTPNAAKLVKGFSFMPPQYYNANLTTSNIGKRRTKRFRLDASKQSWVEQVLYCDETLDDTLDDTLSDSLDAYCADAAISTTIVPIGSSSRADFEGACRHANSVLKLKKPKNVCIRFLKYN